MGASHVALVVNNPPTNTGRYKIPESGRSPGRGHDKPLQYSCLENPMDRGGFSRCRAQALGTRVSVVVASRLSSGGAQA